MSLPEDQILKKHKRWNPGTEKLRFCKFIFLSYYTTGKWEPKRLKHSVKCEFNYSDAFDEIEDEVLRYEFQELILECNYTLT